MEGVEAVLPMVWYEGRVKGTEEETLKHLGGGPEEGDRAIGFGFVFWLAGF